MVVDWVNGCVVSQVQHQPQWHQHWLESLPCFFSLCTLCSWPCVSPEAPEEPACYDLSFTTWVHSHNTFTLKKEEKKNHFLVTQWKNPFFIYSKNCPWLSSRCLSRFHKLPPHSEELSPSTVFANFASDLLEILFFKN